MSMIRRDWTAHDADTWTKEDWLTIVLSPIGYFLLAIGTFWSFMLQWYGFVVLGVAAVVIALMHWVIDPKLQSISTEYEKKQQQYIDELERKNRWEAEDE